MNDGSNYITGKTNYNAIRLGFASFNEKEMQEVMGILAKAIRK
ncbi:hypothetical protein [Paraflavitalea soli]|nr:hypothetical protein [Paraflavitalea soli]